MEASFSLSRSGVWQGKNLCLSKCIINSRPIHLHHLRHITKFHISLHHLPHITKSPTNPTSIAQWHHRPQKSVGRPPITHALASALPSHTSAQIPWQHWPPQIRHMLRSRYHLRWWSRSYPFQITHHFPRWCCSKLVVKAPAKIHIFLAIARGEVSAEFFGVPSRARYGRRLFVLCPLWKRNDAQFLPKICS
jgi:hypothetical protein